MGKKRERYQNPQPFLPANDDDNHSLASSRRRSKPAKRHQEQEEMIPSGMSSKILKEALIQQREIEEEENLERNPNSNAFFEAGEEARQQEEERDNLDDIDEFHGFADGQSQYGDYADDFNEEDEKLLQAFLSKDAGPLRNLADVILEKIESQKADASSGAQPLPKIDLSAIKLYKGIGEFLSKYNSGKVPKAFKHIPSLQNWEEVLYLTEPEKWSANAMYQATRIFASNLSRAKVERFYKFVLLPRVREDIRKNKRLHFALYQSLKKALYKPSAFNKGFFFPLCESGTCTLREAVIVGSVIEKMSIPPLHSCVAVLKLAEMNYCGTTSYFIKLLLEKKYALPYRVVDGLVAHFMRFLGDERIMPVIWHQSLLAFVQRYKKALLKEQKESLRKLVAKQKHKFVTPEIIRELDNSLNRGEKEDDLMSIASPISVINKPIEEDRFDIPDVPMEEDY